MPTRQGATTGDRVLDVAEDLIRKGGYHAASFRDIAARVGIKSASIHYHFPTKEALGVAVVQRYLQRTLTHLGDPDSPDLTARARLERYIDMFRESLVKHRRPCLSGMINAEAAGIPDSVRDAACEFSRRHVDWLVRALGPGTALPPETVRARAWLTMSSMQGTLAVALAGAGQEAFEAVAGQVAGLWFPGRS